MFLKSVEVKKNIGPLKKETKIVFDKPVTVIVGPQKCGKSLLLSLLAKKKSGCLDVVLYENAQGLVRFFDSEHDNPRMMKSADEFASTDEIFFTMQAKREMSHGQTIREIVLGVLDMHFRGNNDILFLDEPESGLHPKNVGELARKLSKATENQQVIMVSHHPWLIEGIRNAAVYDLKNRKFVEPAEYLGQFWKKKSTTPA